MLIHGSTRDIPIRTSITLRRSPGCFPHRKRYYGVEVLVFIDFGHRRAHEGPTGALHTRLAPINLLYAHQMILVQCLTSVPDGVDWLRPARLVHIRQTIGTAIKKVHYHLDMHLQCKPSEITDWVSQVEARCDVGRLPPPPPTAGSEDVHQRQDGHEPVLGLYDTFVIEALGQVEVLDYSALGWGVEHMASLAESLTLCTRLRSLNLYGNLITDVGLHALAGSYLLPRGTRSRRQP